MIDITQYIRRYKKDQSADHVMYRCSDDALEQCSKMQSDDHADLLTEDLMWSSSSLLECRRVLEHDVVYMHEALLKTYPTKFLTKAVVRCLCKKLGVQRCLTQMSLEFSKFADNNSLMLYDLKLDKFIDWELNDGLQQQAMLKLKCMNINGDVAGRVTYCLGVVTYDQQSDLQAFNAAEKDLINCGQRLGYDYIAQSMQYDSKHSMLLCFVLFESKMQETDIEIEDNLWHIAPLSAKDKILRDGLVPKSKTFMSGEKVNHSDRMYLFNGYNKETFDRFLSQLDKKSAQYDSVKKILMKSRDYALFKIDRKRIPDLKLYRDNNFMSKDLHHPTALYTYSVIPASAIELYDIAHVD